jgi:hypothetical protein
MRQANWTWRSSRWLGFAMLCPYHILLALSSPGALAALSVAVGPVQHQQSRKGAPAASAPVAVVLTAAETRLASYWPLWNVAKHFDN